MKLARVSSPLVLSLLSSLLLSSLLLARAAAAEPTFEGPWWGQLSVGALKLRIAFKLHHDAKGWTAEMQSPDQSPQWLPVEHVAVDGDAVKLDMPKLHASYAGTRTGDTIAGTFTQGGPLPLALARGEVPSLRRPQEPKPPYPYAVEDVTVPNTAAELYLSCTLTHPEAAKFPVVVFITGSGPQDRDEMVMGHRPFWILADALARHGVGALRCDDRGTGKSTGSFATATTLDFVTDTEAQLAWLATRPGVDGKHVGLIGHSEGGVIAPIVASRHKDVAFVVLLAGTGLRGDAIIVAQAGQVARSLGSDDKQVAAVEAQQRKIVDIIMAEKDDAKATAKLRALLGGDAVAEATLNAQLKALLSPWYRGFLSLDPKPYLQKLRMPVLALHGERDVQVPPVENARAIREALAHDGDVTVKQLTGLNHLFQRCQACTVAEYQAIEETMAPAALDVVVDWVQRHAR